MVCWISRARVHAYNMYTQEAEGRHRTAENEAAEAREQRSQMEEELQETKRQMDHVRADHVRAKEALTLDLKQSKHQLQEAQTTEAELMVTIQEMADEAVHFAGYMEERDEARQALKDCQAELTTVHV